MEFNISGIMSSSGGSDMRPETDGRASSTSNEGDSAGTRTPGHGELRLLTAAGSKRDKSGGYTQTFNANCLNCGVELHMSLGPRCQSFQCCQCSAIHLVLLVAPDTPFVPSFRVTSVPTALKDFWPPLLTRSVAVAAMPCCADQQSRPWASRR